MFASASCFGSRLRTGGRHERTSKQSFGRCVSGSSRTRSSRSFPTLSRISLAALLVVVATGTFAQTALTPVSSGNRKIVRRWALPGDPRGVAIGGDGTIYVGVAEPQAVLAIDPKSGVVKHRLVLDSAEIASTKELVTL